MMIYKRKFDYSDIFARKLILILCDLSAILYTVVITGLILLQLPTIEPNF